MDEIDRHIIRRLEKDGRISYEQLGKELDITGVAVKKRVKKLIDGKTISICSQLNTRALGYYLNMVLLEVDNETHMRSITSVFERCPRVISMFKGLGRFNLIALTLAEDRATLESELMGSCSLRSKEGIRKSEVIQLEGGLPSPFLPVRSSLATKDGEETPCGVFCGTCDRYQKGQCLGCPATRFYRGDL
ncbi:MAG: AsnC family transcriptional regulator [Methanomassiliicoccales archaeon]|nr:AsnC family transcriptional regulator [Methanomassiliicoccales archaeon]